MSPKIRKGFLCFPRVFISFPLTYSCIENPRINICSRYRNFYDRKDTSGHLCRDSFASKKESSRNPKRDCICRPSLFPRVPNLGFPGVAALCNCLRSSPEMGSEAATVHPRNLRRNLPNCHRTTSGHLGISKSALKEASGLLFVGSVGILCVL